jgi:hypothetical protein
MYLLTIVPNISPANHQMLIAGRNSSASKVSDYWYLSVVILVTDECLVACVHNVQCSFLWQITEH